jgi:hypothetical protein
MGLTNFTDSLHVQHLLFCSSLWLIFREYGAGAEVGQF